MEEIIPELIGISITKKLMGEMEEISSADVSIETGIFGDIRGKKRNRQISVLFEDDWLDACNDVNENLHWMNRRANLFVELKSKFEHLSDEELWSKAKLISKKTSK